MRSPCDVGSMWSGVVWSRSSGWSAVMVLPQRSHGWPYAVGSSAVRVVRWLLLYPRCVAVPRCFSCSLRQSGHRLLPWWSSAQSGVEQMIHLIVGLRVF